MSDIEQFQGFTVRFVGTPDKLEWVATDVVGVLYPEIDMKVRSTYLRGVPVEWKGLQKVQTLGGQQEMVTLFEPGMYYLIARSNSPIAVPFQKWLFEEVLPTIRKTGYFDTRQHRNLPPALEERKARLEIIQAGMDLFSQLGGVDERTELQIKDVVRNIILAEELQPAITSSSQESKRQEYPISDRLIDLGYGTQKLDVLKSIGQTASNLYFARYGRRPPKREQYVDGTTRMVVYYSSSDLTIVDEAIKRKLGDPP